MNNCYPKRDKKLENITKSIDILKAVSESNRLRILYTLAKTDICVCDLARKMNISRNLLSFHLKTLSKAGILDKRRDGNQIFYFIKSEWKKRIKYFFLFMNIN